MLSKACPRLRGRHAFHKGAWAPSDPYLGSKELFLIYRNPVSKPVRCVSPSDSSWIRHVTIADGSTTQHRRDSIRGVGTCTPPQRHGLALCAIVQKTRR